MRHGFIGAGVHGFLQKNQVTFVWVTSWTQRRRLPTKVNRWLQPSLIRLKPLSALFISDYREESKLGYRGSSVGSARFLSYVARTGCPLEQISTLCRVTSRDVRSIRLGSVLFRLYDNDNFQVIECGTLSLLAVDFRAGSTFYFLDSTESLKTMHRTCDSRTLRSKACLWASQVIKFRVLK